MNLKLLDPRRVIAAAEAAYHDGLAPLPAVEGFIRQILSWRDYLRGIYWQRMPGYLDLNALAAHQDLPAFYWTGYLDAVTTCSIWRHPYLRASAEVRHCGVCCVAGRCQLAR